MMPNYRLIVDAQRRSLMNTTLIFGKLESLSRYVQRIEKKRPGTADVLRGDFDLHDIIALNLERMVQITVDIASIVLPSAKSGWLQEHRRARVR
jgi:hypothetical protein